MGLRLFRILDLFVRMCQWILSQDKQLADGALNGLALRPQLLATGLRDSAILVVMK